MADTASEYTLSTPAGTIYFNDSGIDAFNLLNGPNEYYLTSIKGLDGAPLRTPIDNRPQTDGGLVHNFFEGPRHITAEGALMIRSTRVQNDVRKIRNDMEEALRLALRSIRNADGTLTWVVPMTLSNDTRVLTVRCEIPVEYDGIELKTFTFGLVAATPEWT